jgi:hypothetical protein
LSRQRLADGGDVVSRMRRPRSFFRQLFLSLVLESLARLDGLHKLGEPNARPHRVSKPRPCAYHICVVWLLLSASGGLHRILQEASLGMRGRGYYDVS